MPNIITFWKSLLGGDFSPLGPNSFLNYVFFLFAQWLIMLCYEKWRKTRLRRGSNKTFPNSHQPEIIIDNLWSVSRPLATCTYKKVYTNTRTDARHTHQFVTCFSCCILVTCIQQCVIDSFSRWRIFIGVTFSKLFRGLVN